MTESEKKATTVQHRSEVLEVIIGSFNEEELLEAWGVGDFLAERAVTNEGAVTAFPAQDFCIIN